MPKPCYLFALADPALSLVLNFFNLESFCMTCRDLESGYMECDSVPAKPDPGLLSASDHLELLPYRSLGAGRMKLIGEGEWPMESYLDGVLRLPFQEPAFLVHDLDVFLAQVCPTLLRRIQVSVLGLHLAATPFRPGYFCRVFNAFKDQTADSQTCANFALMAFLSFCHRVDSLPCCGFLGSSRVPSRTGVIFTTKLLSRQNVQGPT